MGLVHQGTRNRAELSRPMGGVINVMRALWEGPQRRNLIQGEGIDDGLSAVPDPQQPPTAWLIATKTGRIAAALTGTSPMTASLTASAALQAGVTGTSPLSGGITAIGNIASTADGTSSITAAITSSVALSSTLGGTSPITANITSVGGVTSSATLIGTSTVTATMSAIGSLSAGIVVNNVCLSATDVADAVWDAPINAHVLAGSFGEQVLKQTDITKIADILLRRSTANIESSTNGDALTLRSLYGMIAQAVHNTQVAGTSLSVTRSDDATVLGTRTVTLDPAAQPITGLNSD